MPLPPPATLRRLQIVCVAVGTVAFLASLIGGTLENRLLAQGGLLLALAALAMIFVLGLTAWWRDK